MAASVVIMGMNSANLFGTCLIACCNSSSVGAVQTIPSKPAFLSSSIEASHSYIELCLSLVHCSRHFAEVNARDLIGCSFSHQFGNIMSYLEAIGPTSKEIVDQWVLYCSGSGEVKKDPDPGTSFPA